MRHSPCNELLPAYSPRCMSALAGRLSSGDDQEVEFRAGSDRDPSRHPLSRSIVPVMLQSRTEVRVRRGMQRDAAALVAVFRESWLVAYRGIIPQLHLESMIRR